MLTATPSKLGGKPGIDWLQVNELFQSIQGEGVHTGILSTFIRLQGCTVGCWWCDSGPLADEMEGRMTNGDTRNTWGRGGNRMSIDAIVAQVHTPQVIITGGEPTNWDLDTLMWALRSNDPGCYITIETSGQNNFKGALRPDWITWSPKQNLSWGAREDILHHADEVKWVVDDELPWEVVWSTWVMYTQMRGLGEDTEMPLFSSGLQAGRKLPWFCLMPEGCPPKATSIAKSLDWLNRLPPDLMRDWRFADRLQYRLGVR